MRANEFLNEDEPNRIKIGGSNAAAKHEGEVEYFKAHPKK